MSTYLVKHAQSSRRRDWLANSEQARTDLSKALPERKVRVFAPSLRDIPKRLEHIVIRQTVYSLEFVNFMRQRRR